MSHVSSLNGLTGNVTAEDVLASVPTGTNKRAGRTAAMVAGTITVSNTLVTANSIILLTPHGTGGTAGSVSVSAVTPGTSFVVTSTSNTDTRTVNYLIAEPAA